MNGAGRRGLSGCSFVTGVLPIHACGRCMVLFLDAVFQVEETFAMSVSAVVGMQWGDEGKGKIVDMLSRDADVVIRCQGGGNAGHTVVVAGETYKLHFIPSGILHPTLTAIIGNGVVLDPVILVNEIAGLAQRGISMDGRFFISDRAHMVLPTHKILDGLQETQLGTKKIGTTGRGIGPTYADKASRCGVRTHDMLDEAAYRAAVTHLLSIHNKRIAFYGGEPVSEANALDEMMVARNALVGYVCDTTAMAWDLFAEGREILLEGAQGMHLDIDFGTYPFVTSSNTTTAGLSTGSGLPPTAIEQVNGCLKVFTTRVGEGPFVTELSGAEGERLRGTGANQWDEFGTTTGRPRRCGWLDLIVARFATRINGVTDLHLTKLDILSGFDELKVCVAYECDGQRFETSPSSLDILDRCTPVYETLPGWKEDITGASAFADLPQAARDYCHFIADFTGADIGSVSVGPAREQTICH